MIIALDARPLSSPTSGVARVIASVLDKLKLDGKFIFRLYSNRPVHSDFEYLCKSQNIIWITGEGLTSKKAGAWYHLTLPSLLKKNPPDIFWGTQQQAPLLLGRRFPIVLTFYDFVAVKYPTMMRRMARAQMMLVQKISLRKTQRVVTISKQTADELYELYRFPIERTQVGLLGYTDKTLSSFSANDSARLSDILSSPFILAVSTLEPRKNYGLILNVYRKYADILKTTSLPLVIAGRKGWESDTFFAMFGNMLKEYPSLHWMEGPSDEELGLLYKNASLFIMASFYEGFGLPLLEALAHKTPALVSKIDSFYEIGGDSIQYASPYNEEEWLHALIHATERYHKGELKRISFPIEEWSWNRCALAHSSAFDKAKEEFENSSHKL